MRKEVLVIIITGIFPRLMNVKNITDDAHNMIKVHRSIHAHKVTQGIFFIFIFILFICYLFIYLFIYFLFGGWGMRVGVGVGGRGGDGGMERGGTLFDGYAPV